MGKAQVMVKFKGNYQGTVKKSFKILPKKVTGLKLSASKKGFTARWKKTSGPVTGYQLQYSVKANFSSAKSVWVKSSKTVSKKITKLSGKKKYYVRIRTYRTVKGTKYYSEWSKALKVTTKK